MRAPLAATLVFVGACAAIVGLDEPSAVGPSASEDGGGDVTSPVNDGAITTDAPPLVDSDVADANDAALPAPCDEQGLVGRWRFDEGAGTIAHDCTSGAHDGTITGAQWTAGKNGPGALLFSDDAVDVGNPAALQLKAGLTLAAWVKQDPASTTSGRIISKSSQDDRGWELNFEGATSIEFKVATDTTSYSQVATSFTNDGQWHHIAGVFSAANATMRIFIDGQQAASITGAPTSQRDAPFPVIIGAMPDETCCRFNGALDDVRVYSRAISATEIQAIMAAQ